MEAGRVTGLGVAELSEAFSMGEVRKGGLRWWRQGKIRCRDLWDRFEFPGLLELPMVGGGAWGVR